MTFLHAYTMLRARWPGVYFSITVTVSSHPKVGDAEPTVEYNIYSGESRAHYYAPSLELAMERVIGCDADLDDVERRLEGLTAPEPGP